MGVDSGGWGRGGWGGGGFVLSHSFPFLLLG